MKLKNPETGEEYTAVNSYVRCQNGDLCVTFERSPGERELLEQEISVAQEKYDAAFKAFKDARIDFDAESRNLFGLKQKKSALITLGRG